MDNLLPIFHTIFGESWEALPPVLKKHYANRPRSLDKVTFAGFLNIHISLIARLLSPLLHLTKTLVPYAAKNVPVTVHFQSELNTSNYAFNRTFHIPTKKPYNFCSYIVPQQGNQIIEYMPIGIGWRANYLYDGKKVRLEHCGYVLKLFGKIISLPITWLVGKGYAEEEAIDEFCFRMAMEIKHPLFGTIYGYNGAFKIIDEVSNSQ